MKKKDVQKLQHGLYIIFWKEGGYSLASVGSTNSGKRWMAPINWVTSDDHGFSAGSSKRSTWKWVTRVQLIADHTNIEDFINEAA